MNITNNPYNVQGATISQLLSVGYYTCSHKDDFQNKLLELQGR